jgi:putative transcriptional regulator
MIVRNNLRILMARDRLSIQDVHEKTGLSRTTISKLYNETSSKIGMDTIVELCKLFNCGIKELLYLDKEENNT